MTDASAPSQAVQPPARTRYAPVLLLLMLLAASLAAGWFWYEQRNMPLPPARVAPVTAEPIADPRIDQLQTALADLERVNSVLRQQVLALTERVGVLGDQVALNTRNSAETTLDVRGQTALALADQWLSLAQGRLELYADPAGALQALDAADRALQGSEDPRVPSLRQTLSIERELLRVAPTIDSARVAGLIEAWQQALPDWPERPQTVDTTDPGSTSGRVMARLDRYFRVRPITEQASSAVPAERAAIAAELGWARVLLARGERAALHVSLQRVAAAIEQRFDTDDTGVQAALGSLQDLINALSGGVAAPRLGTTLVELRALDTSPPAITPTVPAVEPAPPAEAPATDGVHELLPESPVEPAGAPVVEDAAQDDTATTPPTSPPDPDGQPPEVP